MGSFKCLLLPTLPLLADYDLLKLNFSSFYGNLSVYEPLLFLDLVGLYLNELWRIVDIFFLDLELVDDSNVLQLPFCCLYLSISLLNFKSVFLEDLKFNSFWLKLELFSLNLTIKLFLNNEIGLSYREIILSRKKRRAKRTMSE